MRACATPPRRCPPTRLPIPRTRCSILREIKLLRHFKHENIVSLLDILTPPDVHDFEDVYFVCDLMETDLHRITYSRQQLTDEHIQYFVYQILRGLK